jgi:ABC-type branched-subunit amino acid transport system substrate-binding protein
MGSPPTTTALTLSLTGDYARQGNDAAEGVRLWAEGTAVDLTIDDDHSSKDAAVQAYARWLQEGVDLLLGPYSSGLVRAVAPVVCDAGRLLFNHGGSADDLARPGVVSLLAPASSYFRGAVDKTVARQADRVVVVRGKGPFARAVAEGAAAHARDRGLEAEMTDADALHDQDITGAAVLVVGRFEHDVAVVGGLRRRGQSPALLAAVAAGIDAFGQELGDAAEGVLGPVHWWPTKHTPEVGPSGADFAAQFQWRTGRESSYVAAQAAAAGYLAEAAHQRGLTAEDMPQWRTSTLLGDFELDADWRQVGYKMRTVRWHHGRRILD